MKKLLVVMLVLGLASMANAQLYLTVDGVDDPTDTIEALDGAVLTIDVYGDGDTAPSEFFMDIGGVFTWDASQANIDYTGSNKNISVDSEFENFNIPYVRFLLDDVTTGDKVPLGPTPKPLIDTILLTLGLGEEESEATVTITLYDNNGTELGSAYDVHITPEPITVALPGLGGLMLRRRK